MNRIFIIGNVVAKPELRYVNASGGQIAVASFTVAVNSRHGGQQEATFFRVSAWRGLGETCEKFLDKGRKVAVVGEVSARAYTTRSGEAKANLEVNATDVEFLTSAQAGQYTPVDSGEAAQAFEEPQDLPF